MNDYKSLAQLQTIYLCAIKEAVIAERYNKLLPEQVLTTEFFSKQLN